MCMYVCECVPTNIGVSGCLFNLIMCVKAYLEVHMGELYVHLCVCVHVCVSVCDIY